MIPGAGHPLRSGERHGSVVHRVRDVSLGFLTIASYLHDRGMKVRVVNLALRMMNSRRFDVPRFLARLKPKAVGIDLHWLPHAHGALEVARIVKEIYPDVPVIMGGCRPAIFTRIDRLPQVDFVLRATARSRRCTSSSRRCRAARRVEDCESHLEERRRGAVNPLTFVPEDPGLRGPAAGSDGRDGDAPWRSGKHAALQRLVEQSDHHGFHGKGLRLRMRDVR